MTIAVVGGGAAGLYAAWHLAFDHDVILLEADSRLGGHADTHTVEGADGPVRVDSGFIVFNRRNYPLFSAWLDALGVASRRTEMSFSVSNLGTGLEYNATDLNRLFCQRRNIFRPRFLGMVRDIFRFYRRAPALLERLDEDVTLGQWLEDSGLGTAFAEDHLVPMACALWSAPRDQVHRFPMRYLLTFMANHGMLQVRGRPVWETVSGGSRTYVDAAAETFRGQLRLSTPVSRIRRQPHGVEIMAGGEILEVDQVVLACHSDQALAMLADPAPAEREVLSAIGYQDNEAVLHTDPSRLPVHPGARAAWNVRLGEGRGEQCQVSYSMNQLQGIETPEPLIVSLNQTGRIRPESILARRRYAHPVHTPEAVAAQKRWSELNGVSRTWYCGAWWGWGFHEDAVASARRVVEAIAPRARRLAA